MNVRFHDMVGWLMNLFPSLSSGLDKLWIRAFLLLLSCWIHYLLEEIPLPLAEPPTGSSFFASASSIIYLHEVSIALRAIHFAFSYRPLCILVGKVLAFFIVTELYLFCLLSRSKV